MQNLFNAIRSGLGDLKPLWWYTNDKICVFAQQILDISVQVAQ